MNSSNALLPPRWADGLRAIVTLLAVLAAGRVIAADTVWEMSPCRISVLLAAEPAPRITPQLRQELSSGLVQRAEAIVGAPWRLSVSSAPLPLEQPMLRRFDELAASDIPAELRGGDADKLMLLALRSGSGGIELAVREFDVRTGLLGRPIRPQVPQRTYLADAAFSAIRAAFATLAAVEAIDGKQVRLRLRGGALRPRDRSLQFAAPQMLLRPVIRYNDRDGQARHIELLPWTWLVAESIDGSAVHCQLHSGVRSALGALRRGRVEQLALAVPSVADTTTLKLVARDDPRRALAGYRVHVQPLGSQQTSLLGATDEQGTLRIRARDDAPLQWLTISSGKEPLARLPFVPGADEQLTALLPSDDTRLLVEGLVSGLQEQLVDFVIRRRVLLVRAQSALADDRPADARKLLDQLRALGTAEQLADAVGRQQQRFSSSDPREQARIDKLFADTLQAVERFVQAEEVEELEAALAATP